jgi:hypothetical protein
MVCFLDVNLEEVSSLVLAFKISNLRFSVVKRG